MKICSICNHAKPLSEFYRWASTSDGYEYRCKDCIREARQRFRENGPKVRSPIATVEKPCKICGTTKPLTEFRRQDDMRDGHRNQCNECIHEADRRKRKPRVHALQLEKTCNMCGVTKSWTDYFPSKETWDRRDNRCKACVAEVVRRSRARNPEMYERQKKRGAQNQAERDRLNPEGKRARERAQYAKHREARKAKMHEYYQKQSAAYKQRARARKLRQREAWTPEGDEWAKVLAHDPCAYCAGPTTGGVDHVVPVIKGGLHVSDNLVACCRSCNSSKGARTLLRFLMTREVA